MFARSASVAVFLLLASACGGGNGGGGGESLSASEFRDRAEAICRDIEQAEVSQPSGPDDVGRYVDEFTAVIEESTADFHELEPPDEFRERWDEYLELVDDAVSKVKEFGEQVDGASEAEVARLANEFGQGFTELQNRGHEIERELGLDECLD